MKVKSWILAGLIFLTSSSLWAAYILSSREFLRDYNGGVHAYLAGNYIDAERHLTEALRRRRRNGQVKQLLIKTLVERSFAQYHKREFSGAIDTLDRVSRLSPSDENTRQSLAALREQLATPLDKRPVNIEHVLSNVYRDLPGPVQPQSLRSLMEQWLKRSELNQEALLHRFWDNQERWLVQLQHEKQGFKKILYGGLVLFGAGGLVLAVLLLGMLHTYFGRRGIFSRLLEDHYQRLLAALPAGTQVLLGPPVSLLHVPESQQMDCIEAEIISGRSAEKSHRQLESFLEGENPWVRARAAKILYRLNPKLSLEELRRLVSEASHESQVPGMWALAELATAESLDLLAPLAYSPVREVQQGAVRSLLQVQSNRQLPPAVHAKLNNLLSEIRSKTGWIF